MRFPIISILYLVSAFALCLKRDHDKYPMVTQDEIDKSTIMHRFGILLSGMLGSDRFNDKSLSKDKNLVYVYGSLSLLLSFACLVVLESQLGSAACVYIFLLLFCFGVSSNIIDWGCTNSPALNITNRCCGELVMWPLLGMTLVVLARQCAIRIVWPLIGTITLILMAYDYNKMKSKDVNVVVCHTLTFHAFSFLFGVMTGFALSSPCPPGQPSMTVPPVIMMAPRRVVIMKKNIKNKKPKKK